MDLANSHVVVKQLPSSVHTSKPVCLMQKNSLRRKCFAFTGAHEIFRPEVQILVIVFLDPLIS